MKTVGLEEATSLDSCVAAAQDECVVVTRHGKPVAIITGIEGLDQDDLEFANSPGFWKLIDQRRQQKAVTRAQLERKFTGSEE